MGKKKLNADKGITIKPNENADEDAKDNEKQSQNSNGRTQIFNPVVCFISYKKRKG